MNLPLGCSALSPSSHELPFREIIFRDPPPETWPASPLAAGKLFSAMQTVEAQRNIIASKHQDEKELQIHMISQPIYFLDEEMESSRSDLISV